MNKKKKLKFFVSKKKKLPNPKERQLTNPRREVLKTGGDLMENTTQTNHLPTCELKHQAMGESGLATYENAY